jgi:predicted CXXCH cytochrome family protein
MHGPAAVGECTKCHDPHESAEKSLIKGQVRDVCLKCHKDFAEALKNAAVGHPPVKEGPCTSCHDPHGTPVASLIRKKMPDLCINCHVEIGKRVAAVKVPHKPLLQQGSCASCHAAHYSKARGLLPTDQMSVCLGCHGTDNLGKPPLANIKKQLEGKKYLHGPIQKGDCKACHDPHGSDFFRLLRGSYPADLYVPYKENTYGICLKCHEKNMISAADTATATRFRNGSRNLHTVHVANGQKGRTCRICHEPHASNGEKLISKEGAKFGDWKIPINFKISPTGGSCEPGCHRAFKYDREKPQKY